MKNRAWADLATTALLLALAAGLSAGCGSADTEPVVQTAERPAPSGPVAGGTAVLGSISDVDSFNEYLSRQDFAGKLHRRMWLRLAREAGDQRNQPRTHEPELAESWSFSEDRRTVTFRLRPMTWSDGTPITAGDVRFTWQAQTATGVAWVGVGAKEHITDVEVVDEQTVRFHFDTTYPHQLADAVEGGIVPRHVFGKVPFEDWRTYDWSQAKVGSGPFVLERHRPGDEIMLVKNPRYYREGLPLLDQVVIRVVPDAGNLVTQLLAGDIDYFEGLSPRDAARLARQDNVSLVSFDYPKYDYIGWNGSRAPFDDAELRRALTLAIDRESLVEGLLYGFGQVSSGPVLSFWWSADRTLAPWPYDPAEARRILVGNGYSVTDDDGETIGSGPQLEFDLMTNAGNPLREAMVVKIQEQLSRVGVKVNVRTLEMRALVTQAMSGEYDAYLGGWTLLGRLDLEQIFGSASQPPAGANVVFYESPAVDELLDELDGVDDWQAMKPLLDQIQQRIHAEQPYTFLYETKRIAAQGPKLSTIRIDDPADPLAYLENCWLDAS